VAALVAFALVVPGVAHGSGEEEAERQIEFARSELRSDQPERALKSAESALRLCPTCYDAMVVKALAYEAMGNLRLAESLLLAYIELVGPDSASEEATSNLRRLQESLGQRRPAPGSRTVHREGDPISVEVSVSPVSDLDLEPYRRRVAEALAAGKCEGARSAATELTLADPEGAEGWRLAGDAARCSSDTRGAVIAYRRYVARGGDEPSVQELIDALSANLGAVRVELTLQEGSSVPAIRLDTGSEYLSPRALSDTTFEFADLPLDLPLVVSVSGRGLASTDHDVEPLGAGDVTLLEVSPTWIGLGWVRIAAHDPATCKTSLITAGDTLEAAPGTKVEVTAGEVVARVESEHGLIEVPFDVARDATADFDPLEHRPTSLTIVGVPAGSQVELYVEAPSGVEVRHSLDVAPDEGTIDDETGILLAPPQRVFSLRGGQGSLSLRHPSLGQAPVLLVLESGKVNAATYPWETLEGVPRVSAAYREWLAQAAAAERGQRRTGALFVVSGLLAGVGAGLLIGSAAQDAQLASSKSEGLEVTDGIAQADALNAAWDANQRADRARSGLLVGGSIGLGLGGAGFVLTIVSGLSAKKAVADVGPWDPDSVR